MEVKQIIYFSITVVSFVISTILLITGNNKATTQDDEDEISYNALVFSLLQGISCIAALSVIITWPTPISVDKFLDDQAKYAGNSRTYISIPKEEAIGLQLLADNSRSKKIYNISGHEIKREDYKKYYPDTENPNNILIRTKDIRNEISEMRLGGYNIDKDKFPTIGTLFDSSRIKSNYSKVIIDGEPVYRYEGDENCGSLLLLILIIVVTLVLILAIVDMVSESMIRSIVALLITLCVLWAMPVMIVVENTSLNSLY